MTKPYYLLKVENVPRELEDILTSEFFEGGAAGVAENLDFVQTSANYEPETILHDDLKMDVYFEDPPQPLFVEQLQSKYPMLRLRLSEEQQKDWMEEWKKGFEAFLLTGDLWVVPSWKPVPSEAGQIIKMDPGMAFGTGTHETTQLAAGILDEEFQRKPVNTFLDVGTGTGILAMLAERRGIKNIDATEIDSIARDVARENLALNHCKNIEIKEEQVQDLTEKYDFVVVNIIDGVLLSLAPALKARVEVGGRLLLTGILEDRAEAFLPEFIGTDAIDLLQRNQKGEWVAYLLELR